MSIEISKSIENSDHFWEYPIGHMVNLPDGVTEIDIGRIYVYLSLGGKDFDPISLTMKVHGVVSGVIQPFSNQSTLSGTSLGEDGWYYFDFNLVNYAVAESTIFVSMEQTGGDESVAVGWVFENAYGENTAYYNDSGWVSEYNKKRNIKIVATQGFYDFIEQNIPIPGGLVADIDDAVESSEKSVKIQINSDSASIKYNPTYFSFIVDGSGSMGINDRRGMVRDYLDKMVRRIFDNYPEQCYVDINIFGGAIFDLENVLSGVKKTERPSVFSIHNYNGVSVRCLFNNGSATVGDIYAVDDNECLVIDIYQNPETLASFITFECSKIPSEGFLTKVSGSGTDSIYIYEIDSPNFSEYFSGIEFSEQNAVGSYVIQKLSITEKQIDVDADKTFFFGSYLGGDFVTGDYGAELSKATKITGKNNSSFLWFNGNENSRTFSISQIEKYEDSILVNSYRFLVENATGLQVGDFIHVVGEKHKAFSVRIESVVYANPLLPLTAYVEILQDLRYIDFTLKTYIVKSNINIISTQPTQSMLINYTASSDSKLLAYNRNGLYYSWVLPEKNEWDLEAWSWSDEIYDFSVTLKTQEGVSIEDDTMVIFNTEVEIDKTTTKTKKVNKNIKNTEVINKFSFVNPYVAGTQEVEVTQLLGRSAISSYVGSEISIYYNGEYVVNKIISARAFGENYLIYLEDGLDSAVSSNDSYYILLSLSNLYSEFYLTDEKWQEGVAEISIPCVDITSVLSGESISSENPKIKPAPSGTLYSELPFKYDYIQSGSISTVLKNGISGIRILPFVEDGVSQEVDSSPSTFKYSDRFGKKFGDSHDENKNPYSEIKLIKEENEEFYVDSPSFSLNGISKSYVSSDPFEFTAAIGEESEEIEEVSYEMVRPYTVSGAVLLKSFNKDIKKVDFPPFSVLFYYPTVITPFSSNPTSMVSVFTYGEEVDDDENQCYDSISQKELYSIPYGESNFGFYVTEKGLPVELSSVKIKVFANYYYDPELIAQKIGRGTSCFSFAASKTNSGKSGWLNKLESWSEKVLDLDYIDLSNSLNESIFSEYAEKIREWEYEDLFYKHTDGWALAGHLDKCDFRANIDGGKIFFTLKNEAAFNCVYLVQISYDDNTNGTLYANIILVNGPTFSVGDFEEIETTYSEVDGGTYKTLSVHGIDGGEVYLYPQYSNMFVSYSNNLIVDKFSGFHFNKNSPSVLQKINERNERLAKLAETNPAPFLCQVEDPVTIRLIYDGNVYYFTRIIKWTTEDGAEQNGSSNWIYIPENIGMVWATSEDTSTPKTIAADLGHPFNTGVDKKPDIVADIYFPSLSSYDVFVKGDKSPLGVYAYPSILKWSNSKLFIHIFLSNLNRNFGYTDIVWDEEKQRGDNGGSLGKFSKVFEIYGNYNDGNEEVKYNIFNANFIPPVHPETQETVVKLPLFVGVKEPLSVKSYFEGNDGESLIRDGNTEYRLISFVTWKEAPLSSDLTKAKVVYKIGGIGTLNGTNDAQMGYLYAGTYDRRLPRGHVLGVSRLASLSLVDYRAQVYRNIRTTIVNGHYHTLDIDENGNGTATTIYSPFGSTISAHTHPVINYVIQEEDSHVHEVASVCFTSFTPPSYTIYSGEIVVNTYVSFDPYGDALPYNDSQHLYMSDFNIGSRVMAYSTIDYGASFSGDSDGGRPLFVEMMYSPNITRSAPYIFGTKSMIDAYKTDGKYENGVDILSKLDTAVDTTGNTTFDEKYYKYRLDMLNWSWSNYFGETYGLSAPTPETYISGGINLDLLSNENSLRYVPVVRTKSVIAESVTEDAGLDIVVRTYYPEVKMYDEFGVLQTLAESQLEQECPVVFNVTPINKWFIVEKEEGVSAESDSDEETKTLITIGAKCEVFVYIDGEPFRSCGNIIFAPGVSTFNIVNRAYSRSNLDEISLQQAIDSIGGFGYSPIYTALMKSSQRLTTTKLKNNIDNYDSQFILVTDGFENTSDVSYGRAKYEMSFASNNIGLSTIYVGQKEVEHSFVANEASREFTCNFQRLENDTDEVINRQITNRFTPNSGTYYGKFYFDEILPEYISFIADKTTPTLGFGDTSSFADTYLYEVKYRFKSPDGYSEWKKWRVNYGNVIVPTGASFVEYYISINGNELFVSPTIDSPISIHCTYASEIKIFFNPVYIPLNECEFIDSIIFQVDGSGFGDADFTVGFVQANSEIEEDYLLHGIKSKSKNQNIFLLSRHNELLRTPNYKEYYAINGAWPSSFSVEVYRHRDGYNIFDLSMAELISPTNYSIDNASGKIVFKQIQPVGQIYSINIKMTPISRYCLTIKRFTTNSASVDGLSVMYSIGNKFCCDRKTINQKIC